MWGNLLKSNHLDLQGEEGKVILELCIKRWANIDWTKLVLERTQPQDIDVVLQRLCYAVLHQKVNHLSLKILGYNT